MAGLWVSDNAGTYQPAKALWVADSNGTLQVARDVAVSDGAGTYHGGVITSFAGGPTLGLTLAKGGSANPPYNTYQYVTVSFPSQTGATRYDVFGAGSQTIYGTSFNGQPVTMGPFGPGGSYAFELQVTKADGSVKRGTLQTITLDPLPAPTGFAHQAGYPIYNEARMIANSVPGSTSYQLLDMRSGAVVLNLATPGFIVQGILPGTQYDYACRAVYNGIVSGLSNHLIFTGPPRPGPAAGFYEYGAASATTWAGSWRPDSDGLYHGNGSAWGSNRGNQSSWFFYGQDRMAGLRGGRVVRAQVYLHRLDDAGTNAAQQYRWILHGWTGRPGNPFTDPRGNPIYDGGSFARGQSGFQDIPVEWGQALVDGSWQGIAMGNVDARYMHHPSLAQESNQGLIRITIG